ncbi:MAG: DUF4358 domain-containing protein [Faecalibacterium sp.]
MMNRTKLMVSAAVLAAAVLAGCGSSSSSSTASSQAASSQAPASSVSTETNGADALADTVNALLEANPISNQFEIAAMNIEYDFCLAAEDVASYKGVKSNDNGDAGLVLVIQPAEGKAEAICQALEVYCEDQAVFYGNYAEFAQAQSNVQNAVISSSDDCVVMLIASNECADASALGEAARSALAG